MTIFDFRQGLDLRTLYIAGVTSWQVVRNQELYLKYDSFRKSGMKKTESIRELSNRKENCKLTERQIFRIINDLENIIRL